MTAVLETHAKAIVLPREDSERKLASVTVINATIGKAVGLVLRVKNTVGKRFTYMSQYNGVGVLESRANADGSLSLTLPQIDAWSALTVFAE